MVYYYFIEVSLPAEAEQRSLTIAGNSICLCNLMDAIADFDIVTYTNKIDIASPSSMQKSCKIIRKEK